MPKQPRKKHKRKAGRIRLSVAEYTVGLTVWPAVCTAPHVGQVTAESWISLPHPLQKTMAMVSSLFYEEIAFLLWDSESDIYQESTPRPKPKSTTLLAG